MTKLAFKSSKGSLISPETLLIGELCETHNHELVTTGELDLVTVAIVLCNTLAEVILREQRHYLTEYTFALIHLIYSLHYYKMQRYKFKSS